MADKVYEMKEEKSIPVFKILYKNLWFIIFLTVLCSLLAFGYSTTQVAPTYTASRSLILRTEIADRDSENSQTVNQATLAKRYFGTVKELIKSPKIMKEVNDVYAVDGQEIKSSAIDVIYGEKSLIFKITYTDISEELAVEKLNVLIETFSKSETVKQGIMADNVQFMHTQKECDITKNTSQKKHAFLGGAIGAGLSVAIAFLVYLLDNTVKDKQEFEELTGVRVIAYVEKEESKKK